MCRDAVCVRRHLQPEVSIIDSPVVNTPQGVVRGVWRDSSQRGAPREYARSAAFLGLPFAEAPIGARRFRAPVPAGGWEGVRDATAFGPTPQRRPFGEVTAIPEPSFPGDATLNVNVFTPAPGRTDARLPVLVWIHGGGYKAGSPSSPWYDGIAFNRDGVVTVSISYRLGFDGFGWIPDAPHNRGLLDQIEALRWVRRSIDAFGGDPGKVTIAGQSAGGGSVWALLVSPLTKGLFQAGISHSGALAPLTAEVAREHGSALAVLAGVEWSRAGLSTLGEEQVLDLQERVGTAAPPRTLGAAVDDILATRGISLPFMPYLDGEVLTTSVEDALHAGATADIPLLSGVTAHEFTAAGPMLAPLLATGDISAELARTPLAPLAGDYVAAYADLPAGAASVLGQLMSDVTFRVPTTRWADLRGEAPTWLYDFRLVHSGTGLSSHCADLPFAWDCLDAPQVQESCDPSPPQALADAMHAAWVSFVGPVRRRGRAGRRTEPPWCTTAPPPPVRRSGSSANWPRCSATHLPQRRRDHDLDHAHRTAAAGGRRQ